VPPLEAPLTTAVCHDCRLGCTSHLCLERASFSLLGAANKLFEQLAFQVSTCMRGYRDATQARPSPLVPLPAGTWSEDRRSIV